MSRSGGIVPNLLRPLLENESIEERLRLQRQGGEPDPIEPLRVVELGLPSSRGPTPAARRQPPYFRRCNIRDWEIKRLGD